MSNTRVTNVYESSDIYLQAEYNTFSYTRPMGGYKPRFEGVPDDYFPASHCDVCLVVLFVTTLCLAGCAILIGFLYWEMAIGISLFVLIWAIILIVFLSSLFIIIFVGGRARIKNERMMIQKKLAEEKKQLEGTAQAKERKVLK